MNTKHTPGPWVLEYFSGIDPDEQYWIGVKHARFGFVSHASVRLGCTEAAELGDLQANARLIVAAPELLEALILARRTGSMATADEIQQIDAAIAKATGAKK